MTSHLQSSSSIVTETIQPTPCTIVLDNELGLTTTVKVSFASNTVSSIIGTLNVALVVPAGKVTLKGPTP